MYVSLTTVTAYQHVYILIKGLRLQIDLFRSGMQNLQILASSKRFISFHSLRLYYHSPCQTIILFSRVFAEF